MSTRTTYTATVKVPIYVAWKCENCGEINLSEGTISCQRQASTTSFRSKKLDAASKEASELIKEAWKEETLDFIRSPNHNTGKLMHDLKINNKAKCSHCNKKAVWNISTVYDYCTGLTIIPGIISGVISLSTGASITSWLVFILCIGLFLWGGISWLICNKKVKNLPKKYVPVIGSFNRELNEYAQSKNVILPSPDEAIFHMNDVLADSINKPNQFLLDNAEEISRLSNGSVDFDVAFSFTKLMYDYSLNNEESIVSLFSDYIKENFDLNDIDNKLPINFLIGVLKSNELISDDEMNELKIYYNKSAVTCPSCGAQLLENAIFCNKCGTKYESIAKTDSRIAEKSFCRKCGEELFADSEFCHKCGTKIIRKEVLK